jgi:large subunit ribosomal protein L24
MNKYELLPHHRSRMNVHAGDTVKIIAGKDRGQQGRVERTFPRSQRVLIEGHNVYKRHMKASGPQRPAGIVEKAMPMHVSNVMVICTECGEATRVAHERVPQGTDQKVRVRRLCKKCGKVIQEHTHTGGE